MIPATGVLLAWSMLVGSNCHLEDLYILSSGRVEPGTRNIPASQTEFLLEPWKPYPGCAIAWRFVDCEPVDLTADGQAWGGM